MVSGAPRNKGPIEVELMRKAKSCWVNFRIDDQKLNQEALLECGGDKALWQELRPKVARAMAKERLRLKTSRKQYNYCSSMRAPSDTNSLDPDPINICEAKSEFVPIDRPALVSMLKNGSIMPLKPPIPPLHPPIPLPAALDLPNGPPSMPS